MGMSSPESNKEVVRRYVEAFNRGDLASLRELFTPDAVVQGVLGEVGLEQALIAMEWITLRDGKISRRWAARDSASQARQAGI
jgi:ketosteroid isomerase-like protein